MHTTCRFGRDYVNENSYYLLFGGDCLSRLKHILNKVGTTCTIVVCYAPVIVYVYSYIIYDYMTNKPDSSFAK